MIFMFRWLSGETHWASYLIKKLVSTEKNYFLAMIFKVEKNGTHKTKFIIHAYALST